MRLLSPRQDILSIFSNNSQLPFCLGLREPGRGSQKCRGTRAEWLLQHGCSEGAQGVKGGSYAIIVHQFSL